MWLLYIGKGRGWGVVGYTHVLNETWLGEEGDRQLHKIICIVLRGISYEL